MKFKRHIRWAAVIGLSCLTVPAQAQTQAQTKTSKADATLRSAPQVTTIQQLCRLKEVEIVQMSNLTGRLLQEIKVNKDPQKQADLGARFQSAKNVLVDMESSWQRLNCTTMLNSVIGR